MVMGSFKQKYVLILIGQSEIREGVWAHSHWPIRTFYLNFTMSVCSHLKFQLNFTIVMVSFTQNHVLIMTDQSECFDNFTMQGYKRRVTIGEMSVWLLFQWTEGELWAWWGSVVTSVITIVKGQWLHLWLQLWRVSGYTCHLWFQSLFGGYEHICACCFINALLRFECLKQKVLLDYNWARNCPLQNHSNLMTVICILLQK